MMAKQSGSTEPDRVAAELAKTKMKETTKRIAAICTAIAAVCGVVFGVYKGTSRSTADDNPTPVNAQKTVAVTVTAPPTTMSSSPVARTITSPAENAVAALCSAVTGVVTNLPADKAIVVAVRDDEDARTYFEEDVKYGANGQWRADVNLGDTAHPNDAVSHQFSIYAVVMDKAAAEYLSGTTDEPDATYWSSKNWPPGADAGVARHVQRAAAVGNCG